MSKIREKNQRHIINIASKLFAEKGYTATTMADIALATQLPKANLFYYFNSKEKLYFCVLESIIQPLLQASAPIEQLADPIEALTRYIETKIHISHIYPHASKVFANEVICGAKTLPSEISQQLLQQSNAILNKFKLWQQQGLMDDVSAAHLLFTIWAATQTYADFRWQICNVLNKETLDTEDYHQAAAFITQMVIRGCGVKSRDSVALTAVNL
jgi:TetR/AcrR family transcriptional regulator